MTPFDWISSIATMVDNWYSGLLIQVAQFLLQIAVPTKEEIFSSFFSLGLGGSLGLASKLMVLLLIVVMLISIATPLRHHGEKIGRVLTSMLLLALFGYVFFPLYSLMYDLSQGLLQAVINLITGTNNSSLSQINTLFEGSVDVDVITKLISSGLAGVFALIAGLEAITLRLLLIFVLMFYPITIVVRGFGAVGRTIFNAANSAIITVIFSPPIMGFFFVLPLLSKNLIPGGSFPFLTVALAIVGGVMASAVPIVLAFMVFKKSSEVFGRIDSTVGGSLDINNMPPVSLDQVNKDIDDVHSSPFRTAIEDVIGDGVMHGDLFTDMKATLVNLTASSAAAAGHPEIGLAVKTGDALITKVSNKHVQISDPPTGGDI
jgi:hypothetical protein